MNKEKIQELFDKAVGGLLKQGRPCMSDFGCVYRDGGDRCVVGFLLNDDINPYNFNSVPVSALISDDRQMYDELTKKLLREALEASGIEVNTTSLQFLNALQEVHDGFSSKFGSAEAIARWKVGFTNVAEAYGLNMDVLQ